MTKAVILFGHGSRDPLWREPMDAVAERIRRTDAEVAVRCAFLELESPTLPQAAAELAAGGATRINVLPMFLGAGRHARDDLPKLLAEVRAAHATVEIEALPSVGQDPELLDHIARLALR